MIFTKTRKEFVQFRLQNTKNIWRENLFAQRNFGAKVHKSNIRVKRWHNKYEIINSIERQNFCLNYLLFKSNRTALQTHKVEERIFCMEQDVKKICSEANYHLRNISKIRKYSPRTLLKFSSMLLLVLSLTTVTHFYMVFQNT